MGEVVPLWNDRRQASVPSPRVLDEFLHHMRTFHGTEMAPQEQVGEPWTSPEHQLRAEARLLHREHHTHAESYASRLTPHTHES